MTTAPQRTIEIDADSTAYLQSLIDAGVYIDMDHAFNGELAIAQQLRGQQTNLVDPES